VRYVTCSHAELLSVGVMQMGQPLDVFAIISAHLMQKRQWPKGTRAALSRGAVRYILGTCDISDAAAAVTVAVADGVESMIACWTLASLSLLVAVIV